MKARDNKVRFSKKGPGLDKEFGTLIYWITILLIFLPWFIIISKFNLLQKVVSIFDIKFLKLKKSKNKLKKTNYFIK